MKPPGQPRARAGNGASRPQTVDDILGPTRQRDVRRLPRLVGQAFVLVWRAAPRQLLLAAALQILAGLSIAAQLLVMRRVLVVVDATDGAPALGTLVPELVVFGILLIVVAIAGVAQREQQRLLAECVEKYTTGRVMDVSTAVDVIDFDRPDFYDRLERARVNASVRPMQIAQGIVGLLGSGAAVLAVGAALILLEPIVAAVIVLGVAPALYFNRLASRAQHAYSVEQTPGDRRRAYLYMIMSRKEEAQEVRAFDSSGYLRREHDRIFDDRIMATRVLARRKLLYGAIAALVTTLVTLGALVLLLVFVRIGRLDVADAVVAVGALVIVATRIRSLVAGSGSLYEGALFLADFTDFVEAGRQYEQPRAPGRSPAAFDEIVFDRVSFTYPSRSEPSLCDVSFKLRQGEVVALVGENGSGKTTLTKLLAGLYRPTQGTIHWDGLDTADIDLCELREHATVIFQDFARYFLSAHENVAISRPEDINDRERVRRAARDAGADHFLKALPYGYDTLLGPSFIGGSDLSLGQWQRVALARAYFRDAPLLILDEPTASLDPRGEYEIFQQVRRLAQGRTVILVSHRFSSVRAADRILVLDGGHIVEEGCHETLMARAGLYAELFDLQAKGYREVTG